MVIHVFQLFEIADNYCKAISPLCVSCCITEHCFLYSHHSNQLDKLFLKQNINSYDWSTTNFWNIFLMNFLNQFKHDVDIKASMKCLERQ